MLIQRAKMNLLRLPLLRLLGLVFLLWVCQVREKIVVDVMKLRGVHREIGSISYVCYQHQNSLRVVIVLERLESQRR